MRPLTKFTSDGLKICSSCDGIESSTIIFRKRRNQCINCVNGVRRVGHQRKIRVEQIILEEKGIPVLGRYKKEYHKQWYLDNKNRISEESKKKYLDNIENRLAQASQNYYSSENIVSTLLRNVKRRAKEAAINFDLTKEFIGILYQQQNSKCALTGIDFIFEKESTFRRPFAPSIDRINSDLGYTRDNVRLVCAVVNLALNEFGDKVFDKMCEAYVSNKQVGFKQ